MFYKRKDQVVRGSAYVRVYMSEVQDKSICKGRQAAAIAVLQKLYEREPVNNVENDTAARSEIQYIKRNAGGIVCDY